MTYVEFLKLSHLTENDVTADTYRTVIAPIYIHMRLSRQDFVNVLDLDMIKNTYDSVNLIKRKIIELVKTTITSKKELGFVESERKAKFVQLAKKFCSLNELEYSHCVQEYSTEMYTGFCARLGDDLYMYTVQEKEIIREKCKQ